MHALREVTLTPLRARARYGAVLLCLLLSGSLNTAGSFTSELETENSTFNIWLASDPHVTVDTLHGVETLRLAFRQSEGFWSFLPKYEQKAGGIPPAFDWDLMLLAGDLTSSQWPPRDGEGEIFAEQFKTLKHHRREDVFTLAGNHDGSYYDKGEGHWFKKWADPMGENPEFSGVNNALRRFKPEGTWERYKIEAGNILILMLSDQNSAPSPVGRGHSKDNFPGGFPAGAVTRETFNWWKDQVLSNQDKIIITAHHHVLRNTTTISHPFGGKGIHANNTGDFEGASFLYYIIENSDPENFAYSTSSEANPGPFEVFLEQFEREHGYPAIDLWVGAHSHAQATDVIDGKGLIEEKWGVTFMQVSAMTHYHSGRTPMSWHLSLSPNDDKIAIKNYIHRAPYYNHIPREIMLSKGVKPVGRQAPEGGLEKNGWYAPNARTVSARHKFIAPPADSRPPAS